MARKHDKPAMEPTANAPAGIERNSKGKAIPMKDRTPDDRQQAHRAKKKAKTEKKKVH
jgi:hypothetical protein